MKILVIGGTRFMGPVLVRKLVEEGHDVTVLHRGKTRTKLPPQVRVVRADRMQLDSFRSEIGSPDTVIDMIAYSEDQAKSAAQAFSGWTDRVILISSADVYWNYGALLRKEEGPAVAAALAEDAPLRESMFPYKERAERSSWMKTYEKILVEQTYLEDGNFDSTILRLPMVYGPGDFQHRLHPYLKRMDDGRPVILLEAGQQRWRVTRGYVENVVAAILLATQSDQARGETYNVGEERALEERDWIAAIAGATGWKGDVQIIAGELMPEKLRSGYDWRHSLALDTGKIRKALGYSEPVPLDVALETTVNWERANLPEDVPEDFDYQAEDAVLPKSKKL